MLSITHLQICRLRQVVVVAKHHTTVEVGPFLLHGIGHPAESVDECIILLGFLQRGARGWRHRERGLEKRNCQACQVGGGCAAEEERKSARVRAPQCS